MCAALLQFLYSQIFVHFNTFWISSFFRCKFKELELWLGLMKIPIYLDVLDRKLISSDFGKMEVERKFHAYFWCQEQVHRIGCLSNSGTLVWLLQMFETPDSLGLLHQARVRETKMKSKNEVHKRYSFLLGYKPKWLMSKWFFADESLTAPKFGFNEQNSCFFAVFL